MYLLKEFMYSYKSADNVTFGVLYDISCLLFKHIKVGTMLLSCNVDVFDHNPLMTVSFIS